MSSGGCWVGGALPDETCIALQEPEAVKVNPLRQAVQRVLSAH